MTTTKATMAKQAAHEAVDQVVAGAFRLAAGTMQNAADKAVEQLRIHRMAHEIIGAAFGTIEQEAAIEARAAFEQEAATKEAAATTERVEALMATTRQSAEYAAWPELYEAAGRMIAGTASDEDRAVVDGATKDLLAAAAAPDPVGLPPGCPAPGGSPAACSCPTEPEGCPAAAPTGGGPAGLPAWVEADAAKAPAQEPAGELEPGAPVDAAPPAPEPAPAAKRSRKARKQ